MRQALSMLWLATVSMCVCGLALAGEIKGKNGNAALSIETTVCYRNGIGMQFVSIPGIEVRFSKWETRVQDYRVFVEETGREWIKPDFEQGSTHPVVDVSWEDAVYFCRWLTAREQKAGRISADEYYRLPTSDEWSIAAGIVPGNVEEAQVESESASKRSSYSWGNDWPPPARSGNFGTHLGADTYQYTSPVGSFVANRYGLYDMDGNAREWCLDSFGGSENLKVLRGSSWRMNAPADIRLDVVISNSSATRFPAYGFRCVLAKSTQSMAQH